jgi:hypothetical protein
MVSFGCALVSEGISGSKCGTFAVVHRDASQAPMPCSDDLNDAGERRKSSRHVGRRRAKSGGGF